MSQAEDDALAALQLAVTHAESAVGGAGDGHDAWAIATRLNNAFRDESRKIGRLRAGAALRVKDQDSLSLRGLADKIGVAPSRAERLVNAARAEAEASHD